MAVKLCEITLTGDTLDEIGHHPAEMGSDVFQHVQLLLILSLQEHPGQVHILEEQGSQRQGVTLQSPVGAAEKEDDGNVTLEIKGLRLLMEVNERRAFK